MAKPNKPKKLFSRLREGLQLVKEFLCRTIKKKRAIAECLKRGEVRLPFASLSSHSELEIISAVRKFRRSVKKWYRVFLAFDLVSDSDRVEMPLVGISVCLRR